MPIGSALQIFKKHKPELPAQDRKKMISDVVMNPERDYKAIRIYGKL